VFTLVLTPTLELKGKLIMSTIYGFLQINQFCSGQTATNPIGQISPICQTFGKSVSYCSQSTDCELLIFNHSNLPVNPVPMLTSLVNKLGLIPGYTLSQNSILNDILATLGVGFTNISLGPMVLNIFDNTSYPSSITFHYTSGNVSADFKVWLANTNFYNEYPLGEITVMSPIANVSDLYNSFLTSQVTVNELTPVSLSVQESSVSTGRGIPFTSLFSKIFTVYNRVNNSQFFNLPILFGYNGGPTYCNPTNALNAFINYLLTNSNITLSQWEQVIPQLRPTDKFYVIPNWANVFGGGLGSPTIHLFNNPGSSIQSTYFPSLSVGDVNNFLDYTALLFNSYGLFIMPDVDNPDNRSLFSEKFSDYFLVSALDVMSKKMSADTQNMITLLNNLVYAASTPNVVNNVPQGYSLEMLNGHTFLTGSVDNTILTVLVNGL